MALVRSPWAKVSNPVYKKHKLPTTYALAIVSMVLKMGMVDEKEQDSTAKDTQVRLRKCVRVS